MALVQQGKLIFNSQGPLFTNVGGDAVALPAAGTFTFAGKIPTLSTSSGGGGDEDTGDALPVNSFPHIVRIASQADVDSITQVGSGGDAVFMNGGSWSGGPSVRFWLQTGSQGYSCIRNLIYSGSALGHARSNIRFTMKLTQAYMEDDTGVGPKHVILLRSNGNDDHRFIAQMHGFDDTPQQWDIGLGNSVDPAFPSPRVWDYSAHVDDWVCYEYETTVGGTMKCYITKRATDNDAGSWNENEIFASAGDPNPSVVGTGTWAGIDVIGAFGGPGSQGASNAGAYMELSNIVISNTYIGPPSGFR